MIATLSLSNNFTRLLGTKILTTRNYLSASQKDRRYLYGIFPAIGKNAKRSKNSAMAKMNDLCLYYHVEHSKI